MFYLLKGLLRSSLLFLSWLALSEVLGASFLVGNNFWIMFSDFLVAANVADVVIFVSSCLASSSSSDEEMSL